MFAHSLPAVFLGLSLSSIQAEPAPSYESFETGVPAGWEAKGDLSTTADHYKSGSHSLVWSWKSNEDTLDCKAPGKFQTKGKDLGFAVWVYNEKPLKEPLRAELLAEGKAVASFWFWMDFRGWAPLGAAYADLGIKPGQAIDQLRFHAPSRAGRWFVDVAKFDISGISRGGRLASYQAVHAGHAKEPGSQVFSSANPRLKRPWLPAKPAKVTPREREDMEKIAARVLPPLNRPAKGIKPEQLAAIRTKMAEYKIVRTDGRITGRPVDGDSALRPDEQIPFWDYLKFCETVQRAYEQAKEPADIAELEKTFVDLTDHLLDQGWREGSKLREWGNYPGASADCFLRMRDVLTKAGLARETALLFAWTKACQNEGNYLDQDAIASMDGVGYWNNELVPFVMILPDETERLHRLRVVQRFYSAVLLNPHTIGPDGCSYHHGAFHFAYASYCLPRLVRTLQALADTDFRLGKEAHERLRTYARAMAFTFSAGIQPYNLGARAGNPMQGNMAGFATLLANLGTPDGKTVPDPEMVSLAYSQILDKGPAGKPELDKEPMKSWIAAGAKPMDLTGHLSLNGSPLAIHRRPGWMLGIAGMSKHWRGQEIYGWTQSNNYGRFVRNGSIAVVANGNPPDLASSGWTLDGWDWSHFPGSTSLELPAAALFDGYAIYGNANTVAGGTSLGQDGVWGMDFNGGTGVAFKKSVFCFDNRITVITTGIRSDRDAPAVTTLFQNRIQPGHDAVVLDDGAELKLPSEQTVSGKNARWILDNQGNGYLLPPGQPDLHIRCKNQQWLYMFRKYLKDPKVDPFPDSNSYRIWNRKGKDMAAIEGHYRPTEGNFALAWFDHGKMPASASCAYTIVVRADAANLRQLSRELPYEILQQDEKVHAVKDLPSATTGYICYGANDAIAAAGPLAAVNQPAFVMAKEEGDAVTLSAVRPDFDNPGPLALTLRGHWKPAAKGGSVTAEVSGNHTVLRLKTDYYMPLTFRMEKAK